VTVSNFKTRPLIQSVPDDVIDKLLNVELRVSDEIDPPRSSSGHTHESSCSTTTSLSDRRLRREMNAARKLELVSKCGLQTSVSLTNRMFFLSFAKWTFTIYMITKLTCLKLFQLCLNSRKLI